MTRTMPRSVRRVAAGLLTLAAFGLAACGSTASSSSTPAAAPATSSSSTAAAAPATTTAAPATTPAAGTTKNGIPQGPGAGDQDADNSGAPSDGDGNL
jgi:hypothetical protein